ncbi:hypothetical protein FB451DRAFT_1337996 [Mycena latifolia]|nr:hypothetical protein FB451DRAFT_1337996 [Mycena latifolia]
MAYPTHAWNASGISPSISGPLPPPPPPPNGQDPAAWAPFSSRGEFAFAEYHFKMYQMRYTGHLPAGTPPKWMTETYKVCTRNLRDLLHHQLMTSSFKDYVDMIPYRQFNHHGDCVWSNLMSGDWAWKQADSIAAEPDNHVCAFVPIVAGSDKTMVSVGTGHQEYHPVYASPGILTGPARHAHGNGVLPVAFLSIPKTSKKHRTKPAFQKFCRQMYHTSLALIYQLLKPFMASLEVVRCPDGHWRRVIYGIGPYITDYPEQVWLAAVVQNWCPKYDAHPDHLDAEGAQLRMRTKTDTLIRCFDPGILWDDYGLLSADLLHQVIKGTFKDHLVTWVNEYLHLEHGEKWALEIIQDIDRRLSAVPELPGLRRFPDGRDFKQWTGNDSKVFMKIYLSAVAGYLPSDMVKTLSSFMDFCYLVHQNAISTPDLTSIKSHALVHYIPAIRLFRSPNGLCSSITESKHIEAVKEPWRRSSRFNALPQMLKTLDRLDKLAAIKTSFAVHGMMTGIVSSYTARILAGEQPHIVTAAAAAAKDADDDNGTVHGPKSLSDIELAPTLQRGYPKTLEALAERNGPPDVDVPPVPLDVCPLFSGRITVYHSAVARFYAPSDLGRAGGMYCERIQSNPHWHSYARRDTVLVDIGAPVMGGIVIGRVQLFFSFAFADKLFECALVNWLVPVGDAPDPDTGMWVVELEQERGVPTMAIINIDAIARASHLIGVYGTSALPEDFHFSDSLDAFNTYFVNLYTDHHMHEFLR